MKKTSRLDFIRKSILIFCSIMSSFLILFATVHSPVTVDIDTQTIFKVSNNIDKLGAIESLSGTRYQRQLLLNSLGNTVLKLASEVMNILLPSANAADLTIEDASPELLFDDTQDEFPTELWDWAIRADGGTSNADTSNFFVIDSWDESGSGGRVEIVRIEHDGGNGPSSSANALHIMDDGDISFADGRLYFHKLWSNLGIGTTTPQHELQINAISPEIRLQDENDSTYAQIQYNNGDLTFEGNTEQDIMDIDGTAPERSMRIAANGYIGFGLDSPAEAIDVYKSGDAARFQLTSVTDTASEAPQFVQRRARSGPSAVQAWDNLGLISFRGHNGSGYTGSRAYITALASQNWGGGANGTELLFGTTPNNGTSPSTVLRITQDGRVLINGTQLNVPDYVFEDTYNLMPLDDLEEYIRAKQHLPNVAKAIEVNSEGLDLGKTQMSLLEKVEELTLYTIQQHGQIKKQQSKLSEQQITLARQQAALKDQQEELSKKETSIKALEERIELLEAAINIAHE